MSEENSGAVAEPKKAPKPKASPKVGPKLAKGTENGKAHKAPKAKAKAEKPGKVADGRTNVVHGIERDNDLPWCDKKVALFKALKALKAVGLTNAKNGSEIAAKGEISGRDVRHYSYHARAAGLIDLADDVEGIHGYGYFLTAKGAALDPAAEYKKQEATKGAKKEKAPKEAKAVKKAPKAKKPIMETVEE